LETHLWHGEIRKLQRVIGSAIKDFNGSQSLDVIFYSHPLACQDPNVCHILISSMAQSGYQFNFKMLCKQITRI